MKKRVDTIETSELIAMALSLIVAACIASSCAKNNGTLDTTGNVTESATATVGGAVTSTNSDSVALNDFINKQRDFFDNLKDLFTASLTANAFATCPTVVNGDPTCTASSNTITLTFSQAGCVYSQGNGIWVGGTVLTVLPSSTVAACGTFPTLSDNPNSGIQSVNRTYLGSISGSDPTARTNAPGTTTVALDTSSNPSGWDYSIEGGGYTRSFVSAGSGIYTHSLTIGIHEIAYSGSLPTGSPSWDHSLSTTNAAGTSTPLTVVVQGTGSNQTHTVSGALNLQHNLAHYLATSVFSGAEWESKCCYPIAGTVITSFVGGPNDGKSEKFDFSSGNACTLGSLGQVTFTDVDGVTSVKTLTHCF